MLLHCVPLHKHGCMDYSFHRPKHSDTQAALASIEKKGFSLLADRERLALLAD